MVSELFCSFVRFSQKYSTEIDANAINLFTPLFWKANKDSLVKKVGSVCVRECGRRSKELSVNQALKLTIRTY